MFERRVAEGIRGNLVLCCSMQSAPSVQCCLDCCPCWTRGTPYSEAAAVPPCQHAVSKKVHSKELGILCGEPFSFFLFSFVCPFEPPQQKQRKDKGSQQRAPQTSVQQHPLRFANDVFLTSSSTTPATATIPSNTTSRSQPHPLATRLRGSAVMAHNALPRGTGLHEPSKAPRVACGDPYLCTCIPLASCSTASSNTVNPLC